MYEGRRVLSGILGARYAGVVGPVAVEVLGRALERGRPVVLVGMEAAAAVGDDATMALLIVAATVEAIEPTEAVARQLVAAGLMTADQVDDIA